MINKNKFSIRNTKKVLHKVGKQWVVVSAVLLGLVAGGAAVTNANADQTQTAQAAQQTTQISPADKAKAQNAIADLKAHKGDIVNKSVNEVHAHVNPQNSAQSNAYQNLASMAKTSNLDQFANNEVSLGNTSSANMNTWMGEFNTAKSYASAINSSRLNNALNKFNGYLNEPVSNKVKNVPVSLSLPSSALNEFRNVPAIVNAQSEITSIENNPKSVISTHEDMIPNQYRSEYNKYQNLIDFSFTNKNAISYDVNIDGSANVNDSVNNIINNQYVPITFNNGSKVTLSNVSVSPLQASLNSSAYDQFINDAKTQYLNGHPKRKAKYEAAQNTPFASVADSKLNKIINDSFGNIVKGFVGQLNNTLDSQNTENNVANDVKAQANNVDLSNQTVKVPFPENYNISDIINLLDGKQGFNTGNSLYDKEFSEVHNALESAASNKNASNDLDRVADVLRAGTQMLSNASMSSEYDNLVDALATLPNDTTNSTEASQLKRAASNANALASEYSNASVSSDNSADSSDTIRFLSDAARQAGSVATSLMAGSSVTPASNSKASSSASSQSTSSNNSFEPNNNNNNASTNTNNGAYVPYIAPDNFASSVAAQMNGNNSASASSNASTSASASSNNVAPATKKHAVNYAKVVKALQLHTNPNFTKRNGVAVVKPGSAFKIEKSVKAHNGALRYEVKYNKKNYFITANKRFVNAYYKAAKHANHANHSVNNYVHYRYAKVIKHLRLHTSAKFTKRNGVKAVRPGAEFHINRIVKNHGLVRYEVRHNHKNYFITASHHYTVNAYVQKYNFRKHGYKAVRVIKPLDEYRKLGFSKRNFIRHFYRGSVLPVKKVVTIASGEMTRLQLTNGRYVSANKDFVEPIR